MTVKELIEKLKELPEDAEIVLDGDWDQNGYLSVYKAGQKYNRHAHLFYLDGTAI